MSERVRWVLVWYGWRGWLKRPVWHCRVEFRSVSWWTEEWGAGPLSIQRRVGW